MYEKLLVPLDGSELAECTFPHVKTFIEGCQVSHVVFVRVVEPTTTSGHGDYVISPEILHEMESARNSAAKDYLDQVVKSRNSIVLIIFFLNSVMAYLLED